MMAPRLMLTTAMIFALGIDPPVLGEFDIAKYALTQGGLLIVVLVLLYWNRVDNKQKHRENQDKISVLTAIAERSAVAAERGAQAGEANAAAINRLSAAVEHFERRR